MYPASDHKPSHVVADGNAVESVDDFIYLSSLEPQASTAEATGSRGQLTPHFFGYAVHMRRLTPSFCQLFRLRPPLFVTLCGLRSTAGLSWNAVLMLHIPLCRNKLVNLLSAYEGAYIRYVCLISVTAHCGDSIVYLSSIFLWMPAWHRYSVSIIYSATTLNRPAIAEDLDDNIENG